MRVLSQVEIVVTDETSQRFTELLTVWSSPSKKMVVSWFDIITEYAYKYSISPVQGRSVLGRLLIHMYMDNFIHPPMTVTHLVGCTKSRTRRPHKIDSEANVVREPAGVGTLTRTKSLIHAAVRVWELKQRIRY